MNKPFLYAAVALLATIVLSLVSMIYYESRLHITKVVYPQTVDPLLSDSVVQEQKLEVTKLTVAPQKRIVKEKTDVLSIATEIDDYMHSQKLPENNLSKTLLKPTCKVTPKKPKQIQKIFHDDIPRLAIIMDDIGNAKQMNAFLKIPFAITPSLFPVTKRHQNTPSFAKKCKCYMVHMPMEAFHFARPEENTLEVNDTLEEIDAKIASMHKDFPDAVAINNHTGSKFTSDAESMDRLFCVLDKYDITFIDSKTAPHTRGKEMGKLHQKVVLERNIFLDNEPDVTYILNQLKKAVRYAKRHGQAIAICHPRPETFEAFKQASEILKGVKMVMIEELL